MQDHHGSFIVLEGADGSGKSTQFKLLAERLKAAGYDIEVFKFPQYDASSSYFLKKYLAGEYGAPSSISPYTASLFYALDRFEAAPKIKAALEAGKIVLCDRYVGANMAHQGSKFMDQVEQRGFFVWEDNLEFELLKIPRPGLNIFLRVPAEVSQSLIENRAKKTGQQMDEHEKDIDHLKKTVATYDTLCQLFPKDFTAIDCTQDNQLLSIASISNKIWELIQPLLPSEKPNKPRSTVIRLADNQAPTLPSTNEQPEQSVTNGPLLTYNARNISLLLVSTVMASGVKIKNLTFGSASYFMPTGISKDLTAAYKSEMEQLATNRHAMNKRLSRYLKTNPQKHSVKAASKITEFVLPLATLCTLNITADAWQTDELINRLKAVDTAESRLLAGIIEKAASKIWPDEFKPSSTQKDPKPVSEVLSKIVGEIPTNLAPQADEAGLLEIWPRQEFELLADSLYEQSNLPREDIILELQGWNYQKKYDVLTAAIKSSQRDLLVKTRYRFDVVVERQSLIELMTRCHLEGVQIQAATPRYGYEVPSLIEAANAEDLYMDCFDQSLELFSSLQSAGHENQAAYVALFGHRVRAQFSLNALELAKAYRELKDENSQKMLKGLIERISEFHPIIADSFEQSGNGSSEENPVKKKSRKKRTRGRRPKKT